MVNREMNNAWRRLRRMSSLLLALATLLVSLPSKAAEPVHHVLLPIVARHSPYVNPFGYNTHRKLSGPMAALASNLGARWVRLFEFSWRTVQPNEGDGYNWSALANFERKLLAARAIGLTPIVVVQDSPHWATVIPSSCAALRPEKYAAFAAFMAAVVQRYSGGAYDVHHWEIGNEVDYAAEQVGQDSVYGCWGNANDPYYGGREYGEMLKVVAPAIREADPAAKILTGGLAVEDPRPPKSSFIAGMLEVGAAPYFDFVSYHGHGEYYGNPYQDLTKNNLWSSYGTGLDAKANFIKSILSRYGVEKPLIFDEASYTCPVESAPANCTTPSAAFYDQQANFVVRGYVSVLAAGVQTLLWYPLEGPAWRNAGLLDATQSPRPVYYAYRTLIERLAGAELPPVVVDYGVDVHGYRFHHDTFSTDVVYTAFIEPHTISWPQSGHVAMYDRFGAPLTPTVSGDDMVYTVTNDPVYIVHRP